MGKLKGIGILIVLFGAFPIYAGNQHNEDYHAKEKELVTGLLEEHEDFSLEELHEILNASDLPTPCELGSASDISEKEEGKASFFLTANDGVNLVEAEIGDDVVIHPWFDKNGEPREGFEVIEFRVTGSKGGMLGFGAEDYSTSLAMVVLRRKAIFAFIFGHMTEGGWNAKKQDNRISCNIWK